MRSTPEAEGVSSAAIRAFVDAAQRHHEIHSFMLLRHGRVLAEGWWSPYVPQYNHTLYSLSKSFTSTAVGLAVAEVKITVNDKVMSFFPDDPPASVNDNLAALRVRDLLCMTVGNEKEPTQAMVKEENWVRAFLAAPITHHAYRGDGAFGQYAIVMPDQEAVLVITSETKDMQGELDLVWEHLLPAMHDKPLPPDRSAHTSLQHVRHALALRRDAAP